MFTSKVSNFYKDEACPSSGVLLEFQNGDLAANLRSEIRTHLSGCEFCSAEVDFYSRYPQMHEDEVEETSEIPGPLYELAEALLKRRHSDPSSLNTLLSEGEEIIVDRN